jgi:hypothetical protein
MFCKGYGTPEYDLEDERTGMKWKMTHLKTRVDFITVMILLVGLNSAIVICLTAENDSKSFLGYKIADGRAYPVEPEDFKVYFYMVWNVMAERQMYLRASSFVGLPGLWHGKSLSFTIASIAIPISFPFFLNAHQMPFDLKSDARQETNRNGPN